MKAAGIAITLGLGAAAGAVAIMMMPRNKPTRKLSAKAAYAVEDAAAKLTNAMTDQTSM